MDPGRISESVPLSFFPIVAMGAVSAFTDLRSGRIRNWATLSGMATGAAAWALWSGWGGVGLSLAGIAAAFFVFLPLYVFRVLAAGDVKLLMALSAWGAGPRFAIETALLSVLVGGVFALGVLVARGRLVDFFKRAGRFASMLRFAPAVRVPMELDSNSRFAFALPLAIAAAWTSLAHPVARFLPILGSLP